MATRLNRFFVIISAFIFILLVFYEAHQKKYFRILPQKIYNAINYKTFSGNIRNGSPDNVPDPYQDSPSQSERSDLITVPKKMPQPLVVPVTSNKEECLPINKDLRIQPVPQDDCNQPHVLMNPGGRLGNKVCQYASIYLLRHLYGVRVSIKKAMYTFLKSKFTNMDLPVEDSSCFTNRTKRIIYDKMYMKLYDAASLSLAKTNAAHNNKSEEPLLTNVSYYVYNNPGPRALLLAHRDLVRSLFTFREEVVKQAVEHLDNALKPFNTTYHARKFPVVTVHVRRTDYIGYTKRKFNMTQLDDLYFTRAFRFYKERLTRPVFFVVSDDPNWCKKNLQAEDVVIIASAVPVVDMAVLSLGDHHVTSYGTFSFSGALLGYGHITHPIGYNKKYTLVDCVDSPFFHHISRDPSYEVDNSDVVLS